MKERRKAHTRELLVEAIQEERTDEQQNEGNEGSSESEADPDEEEDEEARHTCRITSFVRTKKRLTGVTCRPCLKSGKSESSKEYGETKKRNSSGRRNNKKLRKEGSAGLGSASHCSSF